MRHIISLDMQLAAETASSYDHEKYYSTRDKIDRSLLQQNSSVLVILKPLKWKLMKHFPFCGREIDNFASKILTVGCK